MHPKKHYLGTRNFTRTRFIMTHLVAWIGRRAGGGRKQMQLHARGPTQHGSRRKELGEDGKHAVRDHCRIGWGSPRRLLTKDVV